MNRSIIVILTFMMIIFSWAMVHAEKGIGIYGAFSIPIGDFGEESSDSVYAGSTEYGFGAGIDYTYKLKNPKLGLLASILYINNGVESDEISGLFNEACGEENCSVDYGSWANIPIMGGIKFKSRISPSISLYGLGQVGYNFVMPPDVNQIIGETKIKANFDNAGSFAFGAGGGIVFKDKYNIGVRYLNLGDPEIEGDVVSDFGSEVLKFNQSISMLLITAGIDF